MARPYLYKLMQKHYFNVGVFNIFTETHTLNLNFRPDFAIFLIENIF